MLPIFFRHNVQKVIGRNLCAGFSEKGSIFITRLSSVAVQSMRDPIGKMAARTLNCVVGISIGGFGYEDSILEDAIF
jgi:hypothetical protein